MILPYQLRTTNDLLTSRAGLITFSQLMDSISLAERIDKHLPLSKINRGFLPSEMKKTLILMQHEGSFHFAEDVGFNNDLIKTLKEYHHAKTNPLDQPLISCTQSFEKILIIIQQLKQCYREKKLDFLARLPKDDKHPILSKNTLDFIDTDS